MTYMNMTARQLRKVAPSLGITGASRMTKQEILDKIPPQHQGAEPTTLSAQVIVDANRAAGTMTRGERDALHRTATNVYDPAGHLETKDRNSLAGQSRQARRWTSMTVFNDAQQRVAVKVRQPKGRRDKPGLQVPGERVDLRNRRAAMRRNAFGMAVSR